ncbi:MAG: DUF4056 domain-containing protein [Saprospiraceae bacterium]
MTSYLPKINWSTLTIIFYLLCALPQSLSPKPPILSKKYLNKSPGRVIRTCCAFGSDLRYVGIPFARRNDIMDRDNLGLHQFLGGKYEENGIIYTKHGGFIDIGHLRDYADWTAYLYNQIKMHKKVLNETTIKLGAEGGKKSLSFNVPEIMEEVDYLNLAGSIAYDLSLWHEIATYFGVSLIPIILPEKFSSFSPEDVYSNLLGTIIGMMAIESDKDYNIAVTTILEEVMDKLGAVEDIEDSYIAMNKVESIWWDSKKPLPGKKFLLKRNLDTEKELLPWLVESESDSIAYSLPKPTERIRQMYHLTLKLNEKFPLEDILPERETRKVTQHDFSAFVSYIKYTDKKEEEESMNLTKKRAKKRYVTFLQFIKNDRNRISK